MPKRDREGGFVLFSVIWIAGLLAVLATTFAISVKIHIKSQAHLAQAYQAELAADGLARLVSYRLAQTQFADAASTAVPLNGRGVSCALAGNGSPGAATARAIVAVQDQAGLVDLNQTSPRVLTEVLARLGVGAAEAVSQAIVDFRDLDGSQYDGGGEEVNLVEGGPGLKNAAFQSVAEIAQAVPERLARTSDLAPLFTVYALQEGVDPTVAPAKLKALLETVSAPAAEGGRLPTAPSPRKAFAVDVEVTLASGISFRRVAMITLLRLPDRPYALLEWRQGENARDKENVDPPGITCGKIGSPKV